MGAESGSDAPLWQGINHGIAQFHFLSAIHEAPAACLRCFRERSSFSRMNTPLLPAQCPDCETPRIFVVNEPLPQMRIERRAFLKKTMGALAATAIAPFAQAAKSGKSETLVQQFAKTLTEAQRAKVWFPFDDRKRTLVDNNWHIVDEKLGSFFTKDQQAMVREIFLGLHSPEYAEKVMQQVVHDSGKAGFEDSSVALFGEPASGKFEFVLTGRHCTRRCDGDSVEGAAFGGPIFYGHAAKSFNEEADHAGNVYWYQAKRANAVFQMLDGKQREKALLARGREETGNDTVKLQGKNANIEGLAVADMTKDQREGVHGVMRDLLAPFRKEDTDEAMKFIEATGFEKLHMAFYKSGDIGNDGVWDVWQIEGPNMVWYFRGAPHVHVWVNIAASA